MKKVLLLTTITLALHFSLSAQLAKNSWMIGGSLGFSSNAYKGTTVNQYAITPKAGYFLIDRLAAGIGLNVSLIHQSYSYPNYPFPSYHQNVYGVGPFVRYYFLPTQKPVNVLLEVSDQYNRVTQSATPSGHTNTFGFAAGPTFFLTPSVGLEWTIGYAWNRGAGPQGYGDSQTFKTTIGLQVYLTGKHRKG